MSNTFSDNVDWGKQILLYVKKPHSIVLLHIIYYDVMIKYVTSCTCLGHQILLIISFDVQRAPPQFKAKALRPIRIFFFYSVLYNILFTQ